MPTKAHVTLYTKPGCHLCEAAKIEMERAGCADLYELEEVNIESDPFLFARYGLDIPVIAINGLTAFKRKLTAKEFKRKLKEMLKDK